MEKATSKLRLEIGEDGKLSVKIFSTVSTKKTVDGKEQDVTMTRHEDVTGVYDEKTVKSLTQLLGDSHKKLSKQVEEQLFMDIMQQKLADKSNDPRLKKLTLEGGTVRKGELV